LRRLHSGEVKGGEYSMSLSAGLGTVIGLVFVFALVSLLCSAVTEAFATFTEKRARYLLTGLRSMLDEEESRRGDKAHPPISATDAPTADAAPAGPAPTGAAPPADKMHDMVKEMRTTTDTADKVKTALQNGNTAALSPGDLTIALFGHPLVRALQTRRVGPQLRRRAAPVGRIRNPQYIPPKTFAAALMDTLLPNVTPGPDGSRDLLPQLEQAVQMLDGFPAQRSLLALIHQAENSLPRFEQSLEDWYDAQMGRISGWYKRWSKVVLAVTGLIVAVLVNIDTIQVARTLYVDEPVRQAIVAQATTGATCQSETDAARQRQCVDARIAALNASGLPIWYPSGCGWSQLSRCWTLSPSQHPHGYEFLFKLLGWALTAFAVSFGAPFWFDALSKLGSLRNAGTKPAT
jgi:hypothetical protein